MSDGQLVAAVAAWVLTRCSIASRLGRLPVRVANSGSVGLPLRSVSQTVQDCLGWWGERDGALLAAFAFAADVGAGPELDVATVQGDELGHAQPGLDREGEHRSVAAALPAGLVGRVDQRCGLHSGEE